MQYLGAISKVTECPWYISKAKDLTSEYPSLCSNHWCWRSWSWPVLWRPTKSSRTNIKKDNPFHHRGLECKSKKLRNIWSNRKVWLWSTKWSRAKTKRILSKNSQVLATQEMTLHMDITKRSILKSDCLHSLQPKMEKLYTLSKKRSRTDCGSDHHPLIAKVMLKQRKLGKPLSHSDMT